MDYGILTAQLEALCCTHPISNLANAAALLYNSLPDINWAGFYLLDGDVLILGPFQGKTACVEIAVGRGVCGCAVKQQKTLVVDDVHSFPGHIACDCVSNSEIVIPVYKCGSIYGVLDIDSPVYSRFTDNDKHNLQKFVSILEKHI